jgi:hypothetical protein
MADYKERFAAVTDPNEVLENPHYYGLPTFEEFAKNSEKYVGREDDAFAQVDAGSKQLDRHVKKHIYEIEGYRCKTLEEVEQVAKSQGIFSNGLEYQPQVIPLGGGRCDILVKFVSKSEREKRAEWG